MEAGDDLSYDDESLLRALRTIKSTIVREVHRIVNEDAFLSDKINVDELKFVWDFDPKIEDPFYAYTIKRGRKFKKYLFLNLAAMTEAANLQQELLFQLYRLPCEEKIIDELPTLRRMLKKWMRKLGNDFFILYPAYHSQIIAAGVQLGLMKNYPHYRERTFDLYLEVLETGLPRRGTLYGLGDMKVQGEYPSERSSLFRMGSLRLICEYGKDYLSHYAVGIPIFTISSVFPLVGAGQLGEELKTRAGEIYKLTEGLVAEKLFEHSNLVGRDSFSEYFYPSMNEKAGYPFLVADYLNSCVEMKELMRKHHAPRSLVKPDDRDVMYRVHVLELSTIMRTLGYIA